MNINTNASANNNASAVAAHGTSDAVAIAVLKKSMDITAQNAMALINAIPEPVSKLPPNLGQNINTTA